MSFLKHLKQYHIRCFTNVHWYRVPQFRTHDRKAPIPIHFLGRWNCMTDSIPRGTPSMTGCIQMDKVLQIYRNEPSIQLYTYTQILKCILSFQCNSRIKGAALVRLSIWRISRTARFWSLCKHCLFALDKPPSNELS